MPLDDNRVSEQEFLQRLAIAKLEKEVERLEEKFQAQEEEIKSLQKDRDSAMRWGLVVLGTSVISMATWIFKLITAKIPSL